MYPCTVIQGQKLSVSIHNKPRQHQKFSVCIHNNTRPENPCVHTQLHKTRSCMCPYAMMQDSVFSVPMQSDTTPKFCLSKQQYKLRKLVSIHNNKRNVMFPYTRLHSMQDQILYRCIQTDKRQDFLSALCVMKPDKTFQVSTHNSTRQEILCVHTQ